MIGKPDGEGVSKGIPRKVHVPALAEGKHASGMLEGGERRNSVALYLRGASRDKSRFSTGPPFARGISQWNTISSPRYEAQNLEPAICLPSSRPRRLRRCHARSEMRARLSVALLRPVPNAASVVHCDKESPQAGSVRVRRVPADPRNIPQDRITSTRWRQKKT